MKKHFSILAASVLMLTMSACETTYQYWWYGAGTLSCDQWKDANTRERDYYMSWTMGWVSGAGRYIGVELSKTNDEVMQAWMNHYCTENPDKTIKEGAEFLVEQLQKSNPESTPVFLPLFIPQYNY